MPSEGPSPAGPGRSQGTVVLRPHEKRLFPDADHHYGVADPSVLSFQERIDWYLNEPASIVGRVVELIVGLLILAISALFILSTLHLPERVMTTIDRFEMGITIVILIE